MTNDERTQQADDEQVLERIEERMLADYQQSCADYLVDCFEGGQQMIDNTVLKSIVADILQRHVAAATEGIALALEDEIEALARDRLADLRAQLESGDES